MIKACIRNCLLAVAIAGGCIALAMAADSAPESRVTPGSKAAVLDHCVRETGFMRRNHMELIKHRRDMTVHRGVRSAGDGLAQCIDCHVGYDAQRQPVPVHTEGQFCSDCHRFAAVSVDCFDCHADVPRSPVTTDPGKQVSSQIEQQGHGLPSGAIGMADVTREVD